MAKAKPGYLGSGSASRAAKKVQKRKNTVKNRTSAAMRAIRQSRGKKK